MADHVYKLIELAGSSTESVDDAIRNAIRRASETLDYLDWFEVKEIRGSIEDGDIERFQVKVKVGFRLAD